MYRESRQNTVTIRRATQTLIKRTARSSFIQPVNGSRAHVTYLPILLLSDDLSIPVDDVLVVVPGTWSSCRPQITSITRMAMSQKPVATAKRTKSYIGDPY